MSGMRSVAQLSDLTGRTALVTGAAGHIGLAVCEALVELGATVACLDLDADACAARSEALCATRTGAAWPLPADLSDESSTRGAVSRFQDRHASMDVLVHCAAFVGTTRFPGWAEPFARQTVEAWDAAMRVNLTAAFVLVQAAAAALKSSGHGSVILFSSIYGLCGPDMALYEGTGMAHPAAYGASKAGLLQLTRFLATTLGPCVRVNAVSSGGVARGQPEAFAERYVERTPLRRMAREEDLKGAVAYLASDLSSYVTGQNLLVDGGWTAW